MALSAGIIISLILSIVLLFVSMVLSAMSATAANNKDYTNAHKYSTASAVVCGLSVFILVIVLIIYINKERVHGVITNVMTAPPLPPGQ